MPDIFDQVADEQKKGDIFDQIAPDKTADPISEKAQATAKAAGVSAPGIAPISTKPIDQDFAATERLKALETKEGNYPTPVINATALYGLVETPQLLSKIPDALGSAKGLFGSVARKPAVDPVTGEVVRGELRGLAKIPIVKSVADWLAPANPNVGQLRQQALGEFMNRDYAPVADAGRTAQEQIGEFMNKGYKPAAQATTDMAVREGTAARVPVRMPAPPAEPPDPLAIAVRDNRAVRLPGRIPAQSSRTLGGMTDALATRTPTTLGGMAETLKGEAPIGSTAGEREVQALVQKAIVTPEEQGIIERELGPAARMIPGEGLAKWRSRVTGLLKAARPRT